MKSENLKQTFSSICRSQRIYNDTECSTILK